MVVLALLLGVSELLKYDDLIGKPFKYGERGPTHYDCAGLIWELSKRLGYTPIDFPHIIEINARSNVMLEYLSQFEEIKKPEPHCILLFQNTEGYVYHVGMMVDRIRFIHTSIKTSIVVERLSQEWLCQLNSIYKLN